MAVADGRGDKFARGAVAAARHRSSWQLYDGFELFLADADLVARRQGRRGNPQYRCLDGLVHQRHGGGFCLDDGTGMSRIGLIGAIALGGMAGALARYGPSFPASASLP